MSIIDKVEVEGTIYDIVGGGLLPHLIISADTETEVTVTKGTTEIIAEETSEGVYECDVPEYGTYTIEGTVNGNEMTGELVVDDVKVYNYEFVTPVPEGATVTPTNDIQTWLKCANITDKNYTTLAEVLADEETFEMLLADNNACDYMARSTDWAVVEGAVPTMTDDTHPSGVVSASSQYSNEFASWKAFNPSEEYGWIPASNASYGSTYCQYEFANGIKVYKAVVRHLGSSGYNYTVKIQASNDNSTWSDITDEVTFDGGSQTEILSNDTSTIYKYLRLVLVNGTSITGGQGYKLQFYAEADITTNPDAMSMVGHYDYCSEKLLNNFTWRNAICESEYMESVLDIKVPTMTSNTAPSGMVKASSNYSGYDPWRAFNPSDAKGWVPTTSSAGEYIIYEFPSSIKPVIIEGSGVSNQSADRTATYHLYGSVDGNDYDDLDTEITLHLDKNTKYQEKVSTQSAYKYIKLVVVSGASTANGGCKLQFYGHKAVSKNYYPLIPKMTSKTQPSGVVSSSRCATNFEDYKAFMETEISPLITNYSNGWIAVNDTILYNVGDWLKYKFDEAQEANYAKVMYLASSSGTNSFKFKIQGSNDNSEWVDLSDEQALLSSTTSNVIVEVPLIHTTKYTYFRLYITQASSSNYGSGIKMQIYNVIDTGIIHSASNDTIYYLEEGDPVIVATTDANGIGEIDFSMLEDNVVLYSSVAKDPTNLSNPYHRALRITNHQYGGTKEAYLMPDTIRTLYWFGYEDSNLEDLSSANGWTLPSGYSFNTPTHNTNKITCSGASSKYVGVGNKNAINNLAKIHSISQGITAATNTYGFIGQATSKNLSTFNWAGQIELSSLTHNNFTVQNGMSYMTFASVQNRVIDYYACWYEKESVA